MTIFSLRLFIGCFVGNSDEAFDQPNDRTRLLANLYCNHIAGESVGVISNFQMEK